MDIEKVLGLYPSDEGYVWLIVTEKISGDPPKPYFRPIFRQSNILRIMAGELKEVQFGVIFGGDHLIMVSFDDRIHSFLN